MSFLSRSPYPTPPRNLCELLLRDVASLLVTSELVSRALIALRPECRFSRELTQSLDLIVAISDAGQIHLQEPLAEAGAVLPPSHDTSASALVTGFFTRLPTAAAPGILATEVAVNLRLLAQHIELKARLAAEAALLVGQDHIGAALIAWSVEWRNCGGVLRSVSARARAEAYIADVGESAALQGA